MTTSLVDRFPVPDLGGDSGREFGRLHTAKFDAEQSEWASLKLGGDRLGAAGFVQPGPGDFARFKIRPYEEIVSKSNLITRVGWQRIIALMLGSSSGGTAGWGSANCRIGVGTATQAAVVTDTDLIAATGPTGRFWQLVTGTGVTGTGTAGVGARLSFTAIFGTGDANIHWQEWGIDQGTVGSGTGAVTGVLLNRAVTDQSTKVSGQTWTATANLDYT